MLRRLILAGGLLCAPGLFAQGPPKPGPEHARLAQEVGTWDADVKYWMDPAKPPAVSRGSEVNTMILGGFYLQSEFKSSFMDQPFEGRGLMGFDPHKKKYTMAWTDNMDPAMAVSEGSADAEGKTFTFTSTRRDMGGKPRKWKEVTAYQDADHKTFTMYMGKGKAWAKVMEIAYTRKK